MARQHADTAIQTSTRI